MLWHINTFVLWSAEGVRVGVSFGISKVTLGLAVMCVGVLDEFSPLQHEDRHIHVQDNAVIQTQVDYFIYFAELRLQS